MGMNVKNALIVAIGLVITSTATVNAQGARGVEKNPQAVGDAGVAWYTTWDTGLAEAQRSNRPIFFMSAATTCSGVPGVF